VDKVLKHYCLFTSLKLVISHTDYGQTVPDTGLSTWK